VRRREERKLNKEGRLIPKREKKKYGEQKRGGISQPLYDSVVAIQGNKQESRGRSLFLRKKCRYKKTQRGELGEKSKSSSIRLGQKGLRARPFFAP